MIITFAGLIDDAVARWRRDRGLLLALAGPFLFLPLFAWLLLLTEPAITPEMSRDQRMDTLVAWVGQNLHWMAIRTGVEIFGSLAILALYLTRRHRNVAQ